MRPITIGIGGAHSGAGKTTVAALLLGRFKGWGAIKYTKTRLYCSLVDDLDILSIDDKDTKRMLEAGAERVQWVQSPPSELGEVLPQAIERFSDLKGIIVEGNSAIEFLNPDIIIFIFGNDPELIKESAGGILEKADVIVYTGGGGVITNSDKNTVAHKENKSIIHYVINKQHNVIPRLPITTFEGRLDRGIHAFRSRALSGLDCPVPRLQPSRAGKPDNDNMTDTAITELNTEEFLRCVGEMIDKKENIRSMLEKSATDNKIPCPLARKIAKELNVPYEDVGKSADELNIKITGCELGCF